MQGLKNEFLPGAIGFFIYFTIGFAVLFQVLVMAFEGFMLTQNSHSATVIEVMDFQQGWQSRDGGEPSMTKIEVRDDRTGNVRTDWVEGNWSEGEKIGVATSELSGKYVLNASRPRDAF